MTTSTHSHKAWTGKGGHVSVAALGDPLIRCGKVDHALSLELAADLTVQRPLVGLDGQEKVGPLLLEELKNGCWVWRASADIRTPSRFSTPRCVLSTARSWFSPGT